MRSGRTIWSAVELPYLTSGAASVISTGPVPILAADSMGAVYRPDRAGDQAGQPGGCPAAGIGRVRGGDRVPRQPQLGGLPSDGRDGTSVTSTTVARWPTRSAVIAC
jgi:hypothetical protein